MSERKVIAVDIDDVLSKSAAGFTTYSNAKWKHNLTEEDYLEDWATVWRVSDEEMIRRANHIHDSGVFASYGCFEEALDVLTRLRERYVLAVVTSRRVVVKNITDEWLKRHFRGVFSEVHYAGIWDTDEHPTHQLHMTKVGLCREIGADYLIDDQVKHSVAVAEAGVEALLFGDYKWNAVEQLPPRVTRVADWQAVERYFDAQG